MTKSEAAYRENPNGQMQCDRCSMFRKPYDCSLVDGLILPYGWCRYWKRKQHAG